MADTMRIPQIKNVENALRIYYDRLELSNKDIKELRLGDAEECKAGFDAVACGVSVHDCSFLVFDEFFWENVFTVQNGYGIIRFRAVIPFRLRGLCGGAHDVRSGLLLPV